MRTLGQNVRFGTAAWVAMLLVISLGASLSLVAEPLRAYEPPADRPHAHPAIHGAEALTSLAVLESRTVQVPPLVPRASEARDPGGKDVAGTARPLVTHTLFSLVRFGSTFASAPDVSGYDVPHVYRL